MNVLVDTCVWSLALRRRAEHRSSQETMVVGALNAAIEKGRVELLGIVRQEVLSGIKTKQQFESLRETLGAFPDAEIVPGDHIVAAESGNACRAKGIATDVVDMLLCAVATRQGWEIFSTDPDFERYSKILGIRLFALER